MVLSLTVLWVLMPMNSGKFKIKPLGSPLRKEDIAVAFRKEDKTLTDEVNKILKQMHEDGTLN